MTTSFGSVMLSSQVGGWLAILADVLLKGSVILLIASLLRAAMYRSSAASRHLVWSLSICSLLVLPVFSVFSPLWRIPILPRTAFSVPSHSEKATSDSTGRSETPVSSAESGLKVGARREVVEEADPSKPATSPEAELPKTGAVRESDTKSHERPGFDKTRASSPRRAIHWSFWILTIWLVGFVLIVGHLLAGMATVWRLARRAKGISGSSHASPLSMLVAELGIARRARVLRSDKAIIPMTWGFLHHIVLLPAEVDRWPADRLRAILLHELSHVRRRDCLTHMLARLVCAVYWLNPLVWLAVRQLRIERERACDDCVLRAGSKPSDYADHLFNLIRYLCTMRCSSPAAVPMVRLTGIERGLRAVLAANSNRNSVRQGFVVISLIGMACIITPLRTTGLIGKTDEATLAAPLKETGLPVLPADWPSNELAVPVPLLDTFEEVLAPEVLPGGVLAPYVMYDPDAPGASEKGPYRMWFSAFHQDWARGDNWIGHAWSKEGRSFEYRQIVHTADRRGDVLYGACHQTGTPVVIKESDRYQLYLWHYPVYGPRGCVGCLALSTNSSDGINYGRHIRLAMEPLYTNGGWDSSGVTPDTLLKENGQYVLYYTAEGDNGRSSGKANPAWSVGRAMSSDGLSWPAAEGVRRQEVLSGTSHEGDWDCEVGEPSVVLRGDGPDRLWMFFTGFDKHSWPDSRKTIGFAMSSDGLNWDAMTALFSESELAEAVGFAVDEVRDPLYFQDPESSIEYLYFSYRTEDGIVYRIGRVVVEHQYVLAQQESRTARFSRRE